jgi:hypothetical protein
MELGLRAEIPAIVVSLETRMFLRSSQKRSTPRLKRSPKKRTSAGMKRFEENLDKYTGVSEQGVAIWLPKEVKKRLEVIRANADRNIPLRSLAAAIIMTYIEENENLIDNL